MYRRMIIYLANNEHEFLPWIVKSWTSESCSDFKLWNLNTIMKAKIVFLNKILYNKDKIKTEDWTFFCSNICFVYKNLLLWGQMKNCDSNIILKTQINGAGVKYEENFQKFCYSLIFMEKL